VPDPLHPFLVSLNTDMGEIGVHKRNQLWFYMPTLAYKVWINKHKYWLKRVSLVRGWYGIEEIPLLEAGNVNDTLSILKRNDFYLTPAEAATVWAGQDRYDKDNTPFEPI
jgi:hypothetical protein